jgi:hypothetical protein
MFSDKVFKFFLVLLWLFFIAHIMKSGLMF